MTVYLSNTWNWDAPFFAEAVFAAQTFAIIGIDEPTTHVWTTEAGDNVIFTTVAPAANALVVLAAEVETDVVFTVTGSLSEGSYAQVSDCTSAGKYSNKLFCSGPAGIGYRYALVADAAASTLGADVGVISPAASVHGYSVCSARITVRAALCGLSALPEVASPVPKPDQNDLPPADPINAVLAWSGRVLRVGLG